MRRPASAWKPITRRWRGSSSRGLARLPGRGVGAHGSGPRAVRPAVRRRWRAPRRGLAEAREVDVAARALGVEGRDVGRVEQRAARQALRKIGVGQGMARQGARSAAPVRSASSAVSSVQPPFKTRARGTAAEEGRHPLRGAERLPRERLHDVQVDDLARRELGGDVAEERLGSESLMSLKSASGETCTPTRSAPNTPVTASVISSRNRARFSTEPPYRSVRWFTPFRRNWSMR